MMKTNLTLVVLLAFAVCAFAKNTDSVSVNTEPVKTEKVKADKAEKADKADKSDKSDKPKKEKTAFKIKGVAQLGTEQKIDLRKKDGSKQRDVTAERIGYAQIGFEAQPIQELHAELDLEMDGTVVKNRVVGKVSIDQLMVQYNYNGKNFVRVGYLKKLFGLEEDTGRRSRNFYKRSIVSNTLEDDFNLLSHDLALQARQNLGDLKIDFAFAVDSSFFADTTEYGPVHRRIFGEFQALYKPKKSTWSVMLSLLYGYFNSVRFEHEEYERFVSDSGHVLFGSLGTQYEGKLLRTEAEFVAGNNPDSSGISMFYGGRVQQGYNIETGIPILVAVMPLWEVAGYYRAGNYTKLQVRPGLTFSFAKDDLLQWRTSYDLRWSNDYQARPTKKLDLDRHGLTSELRLKF
jgi:hypothetical protein